MPEVGEPYECISIAVEISKKPLIDQETNEPKLDETGSQVFYSGFSIGGGLDQDYKLSPQKYTDHGIYVTSIKPDGPASNSALRVNDKILQVNGIDFTVVTHKKAVEYIKKGKMLKMLVSRPTTSNC